MNKIYQEEKDLVAIMPGFKKKTKKQTTCQQFLKYIISTRTL